MDHDLSKVNLENADELLGALEHHLKLNDLKVISQNKGLWYDLFVTPLQREASGNRLSYILARKEEIKERIQLHLAYDEFQDFAVIREEGRERRRGNLRTAQRMRQEEETRYKEAEAAMKKAERQLELDRKLFEVEELEAQLKIERLRKSIEEVNNPSQSTAPAAQAKNTEVEGLKAELMTTLQNLELGKYREIDKLVKAGFSRDSDEIRRVEHEADAKMYQIHQDLNRLEREHA
ncbi:MAG: hypothetical protein KC422_24555 [Trueperaceae bacterium]|nr:hypothetical protein [Trueperaceae bacterium]